MIVFLYGPDSFRRKERKDFYTSQFEKKYEIPSLYIDLSSEDGLNDLEESARSLSLFSSRKLIVVENISEIAPKKFLSLLPLFLESKESNLLIAEEKKPIKALEVLLKKPVITEEFSPLKGPAWMKFIKDKAKGSSVELDLKALGYIAEAYEGDSWRFVTELQKLSSLHRTVTVKDLEELGVELSKDYFPLVNGLRSSRLEARMWSLQSISSMNESSAKVFNILAALWPQKVNEFSEYDKAIKFGRMDYEEALLDLVLKT